MQLHALTRLKLTDQDVQKIQPLLSDVDDWLALLSTAELNAIAPLLHKHAKEHSLAIPASALLSLKALVMRHRAAADARYLLMQELSKAFHHAGIPLVALKGLALAPLIYPADYLRPMRDIDVLVPRGQQDAAGSLLRELGFDLPSNQPSRFMRDSHQLPNATKTVSGFTISVEIHHDALSRDVPGHLFYDDVQSEVQTIVWRDIEFKTLGHEQMLHQVARHLAGLHPGAVLKLINVLDVVLYAEKFQNEIDWSRISRDYPHVVNTLKCLHLIVPLSTQLQECIGGLQTVEVTGVGETMQPFVRINRSSNSLSARAKMLFLPPDWWMHLYYNVNPEKSLIATKLFKHPAQVTSWLAKRLYSSLLGG